MKRSVDFWYLQISWRAAAPGWCHCGLCSPDLAKPWFWSSSHQPASLGWFALLLGADFLHHPLSSPVVLGLCHLLPLISLLLVCTQGLVARFGFPEVGPCFFSTSATCQDSPSSACSVPLLFVANCSWFIAICNQFASSSSRSLFCFINTSSM